MRKLGVLAIALLASLAVAAPTSAVSGGATVDIATVPFVVGLGSCTATLIAPDRILTAAHCVDHPDLPFFSFIGVDANQSPLPDSAIHNVTGYSIARGFKLQFPFAHKRPQNATAVNNVALLFLDKPVAGIAPIAVAGPGDAALEQPGTAVRLLGYGQTHPFTRTMPPTLEPLQGGDLSLIEHADLPEVLPEGRRRDGDLRPGLKRRRGAHAALRRRQRRPADRAGADRPGASASRAGAPRSRTRTAASPTCPPCGCASRASTTS